MEARLLSNEIFTKTGQGDNPMASQNQSAKITIRVDPDAARVWKTSDLMKCYDFSTVQIGKVRTWDT
jgi:hypothetical protein